MTLCYNCFKEKTEGEEPCPHCGFDLSENVKKYPVALRAGTLLNHRYMVGRVLGQGGFGITYVAYDQNLGSRVAVKEYMPGEMAARPDGKTVSPMAGNREEEFRYGRERFQEEARTLAKFTGQPGIAGAIRASRASPGLRITLTRTAHPISSWSMWRAFLLKPTSPMREGKFP